MEAIHSESLAAKDPVCWCGLKNLQPFSPEYALCKKCGTLVSRVGLTAEEIVVHDDPQAFYGKDYWLGHQVKDLGNPDIFKRARADMPERCLFWLRTLLNYQLPPGRVLEVGCAHGGFVALLRSVGFDGVGLEMSPWVVGFAKETFGIPMLQGPIEEQKLPEQSFDAIVLNDVVEHLLDPVATLSFCARLLRPDGILVVQMPSFPEGVSYEQLRARKDRFLEHMDGKARQHLNLFSPRAARQLCTRLGFSAVEFVPAIFDYDQYLITSRQALKRHDAEARATALSATPGGRIGLALIDLAEHHAVCEADRAERLKVIHCLDAAVRAAEAERRDRSANHSQPASLGRFHYRSLPRLLRRLPGRVLQSLKRLRRAG
jgi:2-polyprenyl-3-methyl-5-hydroxy-6-metoxy-1,4-benzoquinol methylase